MHKGFVFESSMVFGADFCSIENSNFTISYNSIYREIYNGRFDEKGLSRGKRGVIFDKYDIIKKMML